MKLRKLESHPIIRKHYDVGDQLKRHIYSRSLKAFAQGDAQRDGIQSFDDVRSRQKAVRSFFAKSIGGLPPLRDKIKSINAGVVEGRGFKIEKIIFESRPGTFVTSNLYLPNNLSKPRAAVLFLCGHYEQAKHDPEYQMVCQTLVQAGLIVLAMDPIGQGERLSYPEDEAIKHGILWGIIEHDYAGAQCIPLGKGIARYFVHDAIRAVDYLISRPEVDAKKIGVTGNSGGGTQASMLMLSDTRIAAAAPATFIMNRESYLWTGQAQDAEQIWPGYTARGFDHEDIILSMCPKPVRVLAVKSDFFPIEGTRRTVDRCRRFWEMAGKPAKLDIVEDSSTHQYTPFLAEAAAEFFVNQLMGVSKPPGIKPKLFPARKLWCTKTGQIRTENEKARAVHEENIDHLAECRSITKNAGKALAWLRKRVVTPRMSCDLNLRVFLPERAGDLTAQQGYWWSQPSLLGHGIMFSSYLRKKKEATTIVAIWDGGTTALVQNRKWVSEQCSKGNSVFVVDVSGVGALQPNPLNLNPIIGFYGAMHKFADDLLWLDDDLAALRTYDVIRAFDVVQKWPNTDCAKMEVLALGNHGVYAQLATALDRRVCNIEVKEGISSYSSMVAARYYDYEDVKSVILHGSLGHFDLPDISEWTAARTDASRSMGCKLSTSKKV